jgi:hypothetical protein
MNSNYLWQRKQEQKQLSHSDPYKQHTFNNYVKAERKKLRKLLTRQIGSKPRTHNMDDEMYETVVNMLQSPNEADIEIAREIIYDSNISNRHLDKLATEHCEVLLYGQRNYDTSFQMTRSIWIDYDMNIVNNLVNNASSRVT